MKKILLLLITMVGVIPSNSYCPPSPDELIRFAQIFIVGSAIVGGYGGWKLPNRLKQRNDRKQALLKTLLEKSSHDEDWYYFSYANITEELSLEQALWSVFGTSWYTQVYRENGTFKVSKQFIDDKIEYWSKDYRIDSRLRYCLAGGIITPLICFIAGAICFDKLVGIG